MYLTTPFTKTMVSKPKQTKEDTIGNYPFIQKKGRLYPREAKLATGLHPGSCQLNVLFEDSNAVDKQLYTTTGKGSIWALTWSLDLFELLC